MIKTAQLMALLCSRPQSSTRLMQKGRLVTLLFLWFDYDDVSETCFTRNEKITGRDCKLCTKKAVAFISKNIRSGDVTF